ncbi:MAG: uroporphyrinogen-III C-methyltransferase [Congregibacter sp.]|nr:uroporphyrinogen-III C-methyltransferase [Congregibacter sp.]
MTEPVAPAETPTAPTAKPNAAKGSRGRRWAIGLSLFTLLTLAGLTATGYWLGWPWVQAQWQRFENLERQLADVQAAPTEPAPDVAALARAAADQRVEAGLAKVEADWQRELSALRARQNAERAESVRQLGGRMGRVEDQMDRLLAVDRRAWLGQEAVFLTRLAGQRLLVARDVDAALALLEQADVLLRDTGEPKFEGVRLAIARDRAALAAVPRVDQVGLYARLSGLIDQVDKLQLEFEAPSEEAQPAVAPDTGWWAQAASGWRAALAKLSDHLIVRRRSDEIAQLMTPEWAALARQNIRMLIEQAQIAMLSANQPLFERSLQRASGFVALFAEQDAERVTSIVQTLDVLRSETIAPELPELTETRSLLESEVERLGNRTAP